MPQYYKVLDNGQADPKNAAHKNKVRKQRYASAAAGLGKAKARGTGIDASYVGRTIYNAKQRKAKQGKKR